MRILGISCFYHDSACCLVKDGVVVAAAAEERFSRIKHDNNFPTHAIAFCLSYLNLSFKDIDLVVFYEKPFLKFERIIAQCIEYFPRSRRIFTDSIGSWLGVKLRFLSLLKKQYGYSGPLWYIPHHLSHGASVYYLSGFPKTVIVTFDGVGEWATTTIGVGDGRTITLDQEIRFPHSLGLFYSALTSYLGFKVNNDEYKVMGLASYGNPQRFYPQINQLITQFLDGSFALSMDYFAYGYSGKMYSYALERLFGYPGRAPKSQLTQHHKDIAAATQYKLEEVVVNLLQQAYARYRIPNLVLSGGVALNATLNGKILRNTPFKKLFITPDPGDGGGALGAALWGYYHFAGPLADLVAGPASRQPQNHPRWGPRFWGSPARVTRILDLHVMNRFTPYLGPSYSFEQIQSILDLYNLKYTYYEHKKSLIDQVATLLSKDNIIGWFQGRMEWGPRALGNRSILAAAINPKMKDILNRKIKHREPFRPFAPVVLSPYVDSYFETDHVLPDSARFMLHIYPFKENVKAKVPAAVHVDGSGRLQVLGKKDNPLLYDLIEKYRQKTGIPLLINTSFNVAGEPIVCTPRDAVECFLKTDIDYLVLGEYIVRKDD